MASLSKRSSQHCSWPANTAPDRAVALRDWLRRRCVNVRMNVSQPFTILNVRRRHWGRGVGGQMWTGSHNVCGSICADAKITTSSGAGKKVKTGVKKGVTVWRHWHDVWVTSQLLLFAPSPIRAHCSACGRCRPGTGARVIILSCKLRKLNKKTVSQIHSHTPKTARNRASLFPLLTRKQHMYLFSEASCRNRFSFPGLCWCVSRRKSASLPRRDS